jgi:hypothetical protein
MNVLRSVMKLSLRNWVRKARRLMVREKEDVDSRGQITEDRRQLFDPSTSLKAGRPRANMEHSPKICNECKRE